MDNELTASSFVLGNSSSAKRKSPDRLDWLKYFPVIVRVSSLGLSSFLLQAGIPSHQMMVLGQIVSKKMNIKQLQECGVVKKYNQGEFICLENEEGSTAFLLLQGRVEVKLSSFHDKPKQVAILEPGVIFGEMV